MLFRSLHRLGTSLRTGSSDWIERRLSCREDYCAYGSWMKTDMPKKSAVKTIIVKQLWSNSQWTVRYGRVNAGRGSTGAKRLFRIVGEKLPFEAIDAVEKYMKSKGMSRNGVYRCTCSAQEHRLQSARWAKPRSGTAPDLRRDPTLHQSLLC